MKMLRRKNSQLLKNLRKKERPVINKLLTLNSRDLKAKKLKIVS